MLLIKNAEVYTPEYIGKKDILICNEKIECISDEIREVPFEHEILDGTGMILTPGLIDQHVHVTGGGGEGSFHTRTPELQLSELVEGGITTVVGLLGTDGITRSVGNLYAKIMALNEEGVSAYMLTGAYGYPGPTITGDADKDIVFIERVLGVKLAVSDHRAPNVTVDELIHLASKTRVAGMLSGKPGIVTLHMGDAKAALAHVFEALEKTAIPVKIFRPTHVNRNEWLLEDAYKLLKMGGYIDLTCGIHPDSRPGKCVVEAKKRGLPMKHITISSDGHGSWSNYAEDGTLLEIGVSGVDALLKELVYMVNEIGFSVSEALSYMTCNVADALNLRKGRIAAGMDADLLLLTKDLKLCGMVARGKVLMKEAQVICKGTYEK
ncbi:MAG: beta-aspartyl-peptidase [bacterium]|nr:beta-aspartyl-peptidase [bacterium]